MFVLGCRNLTTVCDHKPLIKILGDKSLENITNIRLFNFKERTMPYQFEIKYVEGKANAIAGACSRYPIAGNSKIFGCLRIIASTEEVINAVEIDNKIEASVSASFMSLDMGNVQSVTIERIKSATSEDECIQKLIKYISCGFPSPKDELPPDVQEC